jgi:hypothetical protein
VKRKISSSIFGLILVCFFLPFMTVSCQSQKIYSFTGTQLVTGTSIEQKNSFGGSSTKQQVNGEPLAFLALACSIAGVGVGLSNWKKGPKVSIGIAIAGVILMLLLKSKVDTDVFSQGRGMIQVDYDLGFWGGLLLFLSAAIVNFFPIQEQEVEKEKNPFR